MVLMGTIRWSQQCVFSLYYPSWHICSPQCGYNLTHTYTQNSTHTGREGTVEMGINCVKTLERVGNRCSHFSLSLCSVSYEAFSEYIPNIFLSLPVGVSFLMYYIVWVQMQLRFIITCSTPCSSGTWTTVLCAFYNACVWGIQCWRGVLSVRVIEYTGWSRELITEGACQAWTKSLHRQHNSRRNTTGWMQAAQTRPVCPSSAPATTKHTPDHSLFLIFYKE